MSSSVLSGPMSIIDDNAMSSSSPQTHVVHHLCSPLDRAA